MLKIQLNSQAMLNGKTLVLRPVWAMNLGVMKALIYEQLIFLSGAAKHAMLSQTPSVRFSYSRLQEQLPFFTRRSIIKAIQELEATGIISVERGSRVNKYTLNMEKEWIENNGDEHNSSSMLLFPDLATKIGVLEAIVLQQIHIRHCHGDGSIWTIRTISQWHERVLPFVSEATVKRLFSRIRESGLIFVGSYKSEFGFVSKYRVNYIRVAEVLGIPVPISTPPEFDPSPWASNDWIDPLFPFSKTEQKKMKLA